MRGQRTARGLNRPPQHKLIASAIITAPPGNSGPYKVLETDGVMRVQVIGARSIAIHLHPPMSAYMDRLFVQVSSVATTSQVDAIAPVSTNSTSIQVSVGVDYPVRTSVLVYLSE